MKTNEEMKPNEVSNSEKSKKNRRWMIRSVLHLLGIIIIILLCKCCAGKKEAQLEAFWEQKNDSLIQANDSLANLFNDQKAIPLTTDTILGRKKGKYVSAIIVKLNDSRESGRFIEEVIKRVKVPYAVEVPSKCPDFVKCNCPEFSNSDSLKLDYIMKLMNDSLAVYLYKQHRSEPPIPLVDTAFSLRSILFGDYSPLRYDHNFIEYIPNKYRQKSEESFGNALIFTGISALSYGGSELLGHAIYIDDRDNSKAERKSSQILGLRIISGISGLFAIGEFNRAWYFHNMEGKFIVSPTRIGLSIPLSKNRTDHSEAKDITKSNSAEDFSLPIDDSLYPSDLINFILREIYFWKKEEKNPDIRKVIEKSISKRLPLLIPDLEEVLPLWKKAPANSEIKKMIEGRMIEILNQVNSYNLERNEWFKQWARNSKKVPAFLENKFQEKVKEIYPLR